MMRYLLITCFFFNLLSCKSDTSSTTKAKSEVEATATTEEKNDSLEGAVKVKEYAPLPEEKKDEVKDQAAVGNQEPKVKDSKPKVEEKKSSVKKSKKEVKKPKGGNEPTTKKTEIAFENMNIDFGEIEEGEVVDLEVKFTNTGKRPLSIIGAEATCGCTTPIVPFIDIAPGESGVIGIQYNSKGKEGKQNPKLTVKSNTDPAYHVINLHGTVIPKEEE